VIEDEQLCKKLLNGHLLTMDTLETLEVYYGGNWRDILSIETVTTLGRRTLQELRLTDLAVNELIQLQDSYPHLIRLSINFVFSSAEVSPKAISLLVHFCVLS